jgi:hypothetical protein
MEIDVQGPTEEAVLVKVKANLDVCKKQKTLKKQYLDIIKDATDLETVFDKVIKQLVTIKIQDLLACFLAFTKLLFKTMLVQAEAEVLTISVKSVRSKQRTK